jgi:glyoxylate reductase
VARVLVTHRLPDGGLEPLAGHELIELDGSDPSGERLREAAADADAVVCLLTDRLDAAFFAAATRLKVVASVSVGFDHVDLDAARRHHVVVCHTPGVLDETTADLTWALILGACRLVGQASAELREGGWSGWGVLDHLGRDVHGATLGVVGYGRIGRAVARRAAGFEMTVLHHARRPTGEPGFEPDLDRLLAASDIVTLHVPLTAETVHLIDARRLALLSPSAVLVNTSRGPVVDEAALAAALVAGRLFAAGLDVYEHEPRVHPDLLASPRALCLPHIGSASVATRTRMAQLAAADAAAVLAGRAPRHPVPGTWPVEP